jgi:hypothetical protein
MAAETDQSCGFGRRHSDRTSSAGYVHVWLEYEDLERLNFKCALSISNQKILKRVTGSHIHINLKFESTRWLGSKIFLRNQMVTYLQPVGDKIACYCYVRELASLSIFMVIMKIGDLHGYKDAKFTPFIPNLEQNKSNAHIFNAWTRTVAAEQPPNQQTTLQMR